MLTLVCICMCSVCWLFWLSCQYLPNDWLERPSEDDCVKEMISTKPSQRALMTFLV